MISIGGKGSKDDVKKNVKTFHKFQEEAQMQNRK